MVIVRMFEASWWLHESPLVEVPVALTISGSFLGWRHFIFVVLAGKEYCPFSSCVYAVVGVRV